MLSVCRLHVSLVSASKPFIMPIRNGDLTALPHPVSKVLFDFITFLVTDDQYVPWVTLKGYFAFSCAFGLTSEANWCLEASKDCGHASVIVLAWYMW